MPDSGRHREETWYELTERPWDVVVIGGGIIGAGIARETARLGLSTLLLERRDFAWGTSGRSSKMIHGGLRYLKERQIHLTRDAVRAREDLLRTGKGLVKPLRFLYVVYKGDRPGPWTLEFGLTVYDLLRRRGRAHHQLDAMDVSFLAPNVTLEGLRGGFEYDDAATDDARLVFRVLREAIHSGARTLNYAGVEELLRDAAGKVRALAVRDIETGRDAEVRCRSVVNAAGVWSNELETPNADSLRLRPLRGSHLVLPWEKLAAAQAVTFAHPTDGRPVFAYPWEGVTLVGTTDLDHGGDLHLEPAATAGERSYLFEALHARFRDLSISSKDLLGTFAGVRPVIFTGKEHPSQEPREYAILTEGNLVTVAGGKLTTFHQISRRAIKPLAEELGVQASNANTSKSLDPVPPETAAKAHEALTGLPHLLRSRLMGRLGPDLEGFLRWLDGECFERIPDTPYTWAELKWAFEKESVVHLDDLLLRRVRLGHLLPEGGMALKGEIEDRLPACAWSPERWAKEWARYRELWENSYSPVPAPRQSEEVR